MSSKSNRQLCEEFRALLTTGFYVTPKEGETDNGGLQPHGLAITKPWRNELWKAFRELEDRLCPVQADMKRKANEKGH